MECRRGKRQQKSEGHLAQKHCVLVTGRGREVCARYITEMKTLIKLMIFLVMPIPDDMYKFQLVPDICLFVSIGKSD